MMSPGDGIDSPSTVPLGPPPAVESVGRVRESHRSIVGRLVSDLNPRRGSRGLDLGRTAIDAQPDPGDVAAVLAGEEHGGYLSRGTWPACSLWLYQAEQALRDDLPRLLDQFVNELTGRLELADQASALAR